MEKKSKAKSKNLENGNSGALISLGQRLLAKGVKKTGISVSVHGIPMNITSHAVAAGSAWKSDNRMDATENIMSNIDEESFPNLLQSGCIDTKKSKETIKDEADEQDKQSANDPDSAPNILNHETAEEKFLMPAMKGSFAQGYRTFIGRGTNEKSPPKPPPKRDLSDAEQGKVEPKAISEEFPSSKSDAANDSMTTNPRPSQRDETMNEVNFKHNKNTQEQRSMESSENKMEKVHSEDYVVYRNYERNQDDGNREKLNNKNHQHRQRYDRANDGGNYNDHRHHRRQYERYVSEESPPPKQEPKHGSCGRSYGHCGSSASMEYSSLEGRTRQNAKEANKPDRFNRVNRRMSPPREAPLTHNLREERGAYVNQRPRNTREQHHASSVLVHPIAEEEIVDEYSADSFNQKGRHIGNQRHGSPIPLNQNDHRRRDEEKRMAYHNQRGREYAHIPQQYPYPRQGDYVFGDDVDYRLNDEELRRDVCSRGRNYRQQNQQMAIDEMSMEVNPREDEHRFSVNNPRPRNNGRRTKNASPYPEEVYMEEDRHVEEPRNVIKHQEPRNYEQHYHPYHDHQRYVIVKNLCPVDSLPTASSMAHKPRVLRIERPRSPILPNRVDVIRLEDINNMKREPHIPVNTRNTSQVPSYAHGLRETTLGDDNSFISNSTHTSLIERYRRYQNSREGRYRGQYYRAGPQNTKASYEGQTEIFESIPEERSDVIYVNEIKDVREKMPNKYNRNQIRLENAMDVVEIPDIDNRTRTFKFNQRDHGIVERIQPVRYEPDYRNYDKREAVERGAYVNQRPRNTREQHHASSVLVHPIAEEEIVDEYSADSFNQKGRHIGNQRHGSPIPLNQNDHRRRDEEKRMAYHNQRGREYAHIPQQYPYPRQGDYVFGDDVDYRLNDEELRRDVCSRGRNYRQQNQQMAIDEMSMEVNPREDEHRFSVNNPRPRNNGRRTKNASPYPEEVYMEEDRHVEEPRNVIKHQEPRKSRPRRHVHRNEARGSRMITIDEEEESIDTKKQMPVRNHTVAERASVDMKHMKSTREGRSTMQSKGEPSPDYMGATGGQEDNTHNKQAQKSAEQQKKDDVIQEKELYIAKDVDLDIDDQQHQEAKRQGDANKSSRSRRGPNRRRSHKRNEAEEVV